MRLINNISNYSAQLYDCNDRVNASNTALNETLAFTLQCINALPVFVGYVNATEVSSSFVLNCPNNSTFQSASFYTVVDRNNQTMSLVLPVCVN